MTISNCKNSKVNGTKCSGYKQYEVKNITDGICFRNSPDYHVSGKLICTHAKNSKFYDKKGNKVGDWASGLKKECEVRRNGKTIRRYDATHSSPQMDVRAGDEIYLNYFKRPNCHFEFPRGNVCHTEEKSRGPFYVHYNYFQGIDVNNHDAKGFSAQEKGPQELKFNLSKFNPKEQFCMDEFGNKLSDKPFKKPSPETCYTRSEEGDRTFFLRACRDITFSKKQCTDGCTNPNPNVTPLLSLVCRHKSCTNIRKKTKNYNEKYK